MSIKTIHCGNIYYARRQHELAAVLKAQILRDWPDIFQTIEEENWQFEVMDEKVQ